MIYACFRGHRSTVKMAKLDDPELKHRLSILEFHMRDGNTEIHVDGLLVGIDNGSTHSC